MSDKKAKRGEVLDIVPAPRMPRREGWMDLPAEYEGFKLKLWLNAPAALWQAVWRQENAESALQEIMLEHNGWMDHYGQPIPPANTKEFWEAIPNELAALIMVECQLEMGKLAASRLPKNLR